jgi:hypothetical protein
VVIALAGRRIDTADAPTARFPLRNAPLVEQRLRDLLRDETAAAMVSSAACGADLLAQGIAGTLDMRRRIVLPFDRARFRRTSVTDRPGDWGPAYDRLLAKLDTTGDVVVLSEELDETAAYGAANLTILDHATALASQAGQAVLAVLVWEGASRGPDDLTAAFGHEARTRRLPVKEILTL